MFPPSPCIVLGKSTPKNTYYRITIKTSTGFAVVRVLAENNHTNHIKVIKANGQSCQTIETNEQIAIWSCSQNSKSVDSRGNPLVVGSIDSLDCSKNHLGCIDFSGNSGLKKLVCSTNNLRRLILRAFIPEKPILDIEELDCSNNLLTQLNLSALIRLNKVNCSENRLTSIVFGNLPLLRSVDCSRNKLQTLDLPKAHCLRFIDARHNPIGPKI